LYSGGGVVNFLFKNRFPETEQSQKKAVTKTMQIDQESALLNDIPYDINIVINIGRWINRVINNSKGGVIYAQ
jgi:hypothetical protein